MSEKIAFMEVVLTGLLTGTAQLLLRISAPRIRLRSGPGQFFISVMDVRLITGIALAAGAPLLYFHALTVLPLSLAFGISALSYIWVPLGGRIFLKESLSRLQLLGTASILFGLIIWSTGL